MWPQDMWDDENNMGDNLSFTTNSEETWRNNTYIKRQAMSNHSKNLTTVTSNGGCPPSHSFIIVKALDYWQIGYSGVVLIDT